MKITENTILVFWFDDIEVREKPLWIGWEINSYLHHLKDGNINKIVTSMDIFEKMVKVKIYNKYLS